ncbi:MAG: hypothetical protein ACM336_04940 [Acidobacteriota bacterium]
MLTLEPVERFIWLLSTAGYLLLFLRLRHERLNRTYRFFAAYLLFHVVRSLGLALAAPVGRLVAKDSSAGFAADLYGWVWVATEPILWLLYILIVLELYGLVFQKYKGIASLGRWAIFAGLGIALAISSLMLSADLSNSGAETSHILLYVAAAHRGVASSLVIFLLLITAFLSWYPVPLSRNVVVHSIAYAVYFLSATVSLLIRNVSGGSLVIMTNIGLSIMTILCLGVWIVFLNREGEALTVKVGQHWQPDQEQHLIEQLASINSTLLRAARK